ncbi:T9SS type A sorting domain-containing protein [Hymenobacter sp. BT18]|uniref:reprolysin-like metallopeptidase n=1 Tax=Hymenobacter sp. BT18 TaxID=2835648 RepID=UPI00143E20B3|nr:zinc-dependent metalloprotease family protein [Hymenobacter sp. BT18]QIX62449.1 T9SS type A sorting domain-containing protein [Hymenobacter sp. BT18]
MLFVLLSFSSSLAQRVLWADAAPLTAPLPAAKRLGPYRTVAVQLATMRQVLATAPSPDGPARRSAATVVSLPLPNGRAGRFKLTTVPVLPAGLAARYPQITTYSGQGLDDPTATVRLDLTPAGLHAQILSAEGTVYIDPATAGASTHVVYDRSAATGAAPVCYATGRASTAARAQTHSPGEQLRTYRLALACTGEYTQIKGGTRAKALAALTTSINRVSGIYEKELAIRFQLVEKEDSLIYLNPATDPYSNEIDGNALSTNQRIIDTRIGSANYDIGHLFCTADGGLAQLGVVCLNGYKAQGGTGLPDPSGDGFDVDFVAHEIGHQFGANHTFNGSTSNCAGGNREASTAYEPGSGSTIMAYAGICAPQNLQANSDPYFHGISLDEISDFVTTGTGSACPVMTATGNRTPTASAGSRYVLPIGTPFALTGSGTDADGDPLTYCWEEFDLGATGPPTAPKGNAPLFRSFAPTTSATRTFPRLTDLLNNTTRLGELLPAYARRLVFRLTTRDNRGGFAADTVLLPVVSTAGPFRITEPTTAQVWLAGAPQRIAWDVAGTNLAPISTDRVTIMLSTDGGQTFPFSLAVNTPNDGAELVTIPQGIGASTQVRIKIAAVGNVYFAISPRNITLEQPASPTFSLSRSGEPTELTTCPGTSLSTELGLTALQNFSGTISLAATNIPSGVEASFSPATVVAAGTTQLTLQLPATLATGTYSLTVTATAGSQSRSQLISFRVPAAVTAAPALKTPTPTATAVSSLPALSWAAVPNATAYELQIAQDADFEQIAFSQPSLSGTSLVLPAALAEGTTYFWRVRGRSDLCGAGPFSSVGSFTVGTIDCQTLASADVPKALGGSSSTVVSTVVVTAADKVADVNVRNLNLTYPDTGELVISLTAPTGQRVVLASSACAGRADLQASFDDQATTTLGCPLTQNAVVRPTGTLASLQGLAAGGTWTLTVQDLNTTLKGSIQGWTLELCTIRNTATATTSASALAGISVFPNPGSGDFQLLLDNAQRGPVVLQVLDAVGREVRREAFVKPGSRVQRPLQLTDLPAGLYLVRIQIGASAPTTSRLIKE